MPPKGIFKPPPGTYTGTAQEWQALSSTQRFNMRNPGYSKAHYKKNAVRVAAVRKDYRENNTVQITAYQQAYRETNKDDINAQQKVYREANKDDINAKQRVYYHANSDTILEKQRARKLKKDKEFYEMWGEDGIQP